MAKLYLKPFLAICFSLLLCGCQGNQKTAQTASKPYQLAIFDTNTIHTFNQQDGTLQKVETLERAQHLSYWSEGFVSATDGLYFAKTKPDDQFKSYVAKIDKTNLTEDFVSAEGNDTYTSTTDGDYYYATAVFTDRIECYKYDKSLKVVHSAVINNAETVNSSNQLVFVGNDLYLLVSQVVIATGLEQTELWRMDKDFNILEKINIEEDSPYLRMTAVGDKLYLSGTIAGKNADGFIGGNTILIYDLATRQKEYIQLSTSYPLAIYHDPVHNNLLISHEQNALPAIHWTIYNLDSGMEHTVSFPEIATEDTFSSAFAMLNGRYYFLFAKHLIEVNATGEKVTNYDLTEFGLANAHGLIASE